MTRHDALHLDESLNADDVSRAWLVFSSAAESALADAYCFSGGPAPCQGLVLGRGLARFRRVRLGVVRFGRFVVMLLIFMMLLCLLVS